MAVADYPMGATCIQVFLHYVGIVFRVFVQTLPSEASPQTIDLCHFSVASLKALRITK